VDAVPAFLLLGVIWAAVLLPPWLQSRREARPTASMVTFRRQLWSLARTSPGYGPVYTDSFSGYDDDSYADDEVDGADGRGEAGGTGGLAVVHGRVHDGDELAHRRSSARAGSSLGRSSQRARHVGGSYRRRRHILSALTVLALGSVVPAVLLGGAWWIAQGVAGGLLVTYLALLVRRQRRLVEQLRKVRYLAPIRAPRPAVVVLGTGTAH
jgi:hypothetical protein